MRFDRAREKRLADSKRSVRTPSLWPSPRLELHRQASERARVANEQHREELRALVDQATATIRAITAATAADRLLLREMMRAIEEWLGPPRPETRERPAGT